MPEPPSLVFAREHKLLLEDRGEIPEIREIKESARRPPARKLRPDQIKFKRFLLDRLKPHMKGGNVVSIEMVSKAKLDNFLLPTLSPAFFELLPGGLNYNEAIVRQKVDEVLASQKANPRMIWEIAHEAKKFSQELNEYFEISGRKTKKANAHTFHEFSAWYAEHFSKFMAPINMRYPKLKMDQARDVMNGLAREIPQNLKGTWAFDNFRRMQR